MHRILHIIKSLGRGGAEMLLPETVNVHNRLEFEFHCIYFLPWKNQMVPALESVGCKVTCFPSRTNIHLMLQVRRVAKYVQENKVELIHAHLPWAGILARIVGKLTGVPVLYTEHNKQERYHPLTRSLNLGTMNWLTGLVAVSDDVASSIRSNKPRLKTPLHTILNGVNVDWFSPGVEDGLKIRREFGIPDSSLVIGTIAVFRFQKRLDIWIELACAILKSLPQAHFIIVGDGPLREQLHRQSHELGLNQKVHFTGLQTEIRPFLAAFDIYMMSSVFEGLPIAMLEAMSSGCPVISTDAGGIKEVIRHEVDGLLCSVSQPEKLVEFCMQLASSQPLRHKLGKNARARVVESFGMQKMVAALENLYVSVIESSRANEEN